MGETFGERNQSIHHYNSLVHFECQGFIDESKCDKIITKKALCMSSIFKRFAINNAVHVNSHGNSGEAFRIQALFMDMLKVIQSIKDDSILLEYLKNPIKSDDLEKGNGPNGGSFNRIYDDEA